MDHSHTYWSLLRTAAVLAGVFFFISCKESLEVPNFTDSNTGPYILDIDYLQFTKNNLESIPSLASEYQRLIEGADELLLQDYYYVTDKEMIPPSGIKNDYVSIARYFHLDSTGAQTIYDERISSPLVDEFDRPKLAKMSSAVYTLALSYYFSQEEKYAQKATELIRGWFIDPVTRMRPNMNYSQIRLGVPDTGGGGTQGIIDANDLVPIVDAVSLLYDSQHWTKNDHIALKTWFHEFIDWIARNYNPHAYETVNVSTWMDVQRAVYYQFVEEEYKLNSNSHIRPIEERIKMQFDPEGIQPYEISRGRPQHYVYFNLRAYMNLALIRKQRGHSDRDWTNLQTSDYGGLKPGIDVLLFSLNGDNIPKQFSEDVDFDQCRYLEIFKPASIIFESEVYALASKQLINQGCSNPNITLALPDTSEGGPGLVQN